ERALVIGETVRAVEPFGDRLELGLAILLDDGGDLVAEAGADEQRALLAKPHRARIADAAGIDLDVEAGRQLELRGRQLVGGGRQRWRRNRRELGGGLVAVGAADQRRARRQLRGGRRDRS